MASQKEPNLNRFNLIQTKLFIPQVDANIVPRQHLIGCMENASSGKLTIVSAPAGYGKTTLVSAWSEYTSQPVAWLSLDENDNLLTRFWVYIITACQKINHDFGSDLLSVIESSQPPHIDVILTSVINELANTDIQFTLVLDDYHLIQNQTIHEGMGIFLNQLPPGKHIVIISRVDPDFPYTRLRASGQLVEFRANDLRFSEIETDKYLNEMMRLELSKQDTKSLEVRTEGWISGLKLAALSLQGRQDKHDFVTAFSGSHYYIIDYLLEEVLARQPREIYDFLHKTSMLEKFCAQLCDETLQISNSRKILRMLEDANLFLVPLDYERRWYRYHHLFAECLNQSLIEKDPASILKINFVAAQWFQRNGFISEAFEHFLKAQSFDCAADLLEQNARQMVEHSELGSLNSLIDRLPDEQVLMRPWLCIYHAWSLRLSARPFDMVEKRLKDAEQAIETQEVSTFKSQLDDRFAVSEDEQHRMLSHVYAIRAFQSLFQENIPDALLKANKALEYYPERGFARGFLEFALGWAHRFSGNLDSSNQAFLNARVEAEEIDNVYLASAVSCRAAYNRVLAGQLYQAVDECQGAIRLASRKNDDPFPVAGYGYIYLGGIQYEWNELDKAATNLLRGIELCEKVGYIMDQAVGHTLLARLHLSRGDFESADTALKTASALSDRMKGYIYVRRWVEDCQIRMWVNLGNAEGIAQWLEVCGMDVHDKPTFNRDLEHSILARALLGLGLMNPQGPHLEKAILLLEKLIDMTVISGWTGKRIELLVMQALGLKAAGRLDEGLIALEEALTLAEPEGYCRTFVDEGRVMQDLLQQLAKNSNLSKYITKLLSSFDASSPDKQQSLIEPLSNREIDVLRLLSSELSGPEIAQELNVELSTVRFHTNNIYRKLEVHNRRSAVKRSKDLGLI